MPDLSSSGFGAPVTPVAPPAASSFGAPPDLGAPPAPAFGAPDMSVPGFGAPAAPAAPAPVYDAAPPVFGGAPAAPAPAPAPAFGAAPVFGATPAYDPMAQAQPAAYDPMAQAQPPVAAAYPPAPAFAPYGAPVVAVASTKSNWMGPAALVCGLVGIICLFLPSATSGGAASFFSFLCFVGSILGVVFGAMGIRAAGRGEATNKGMAIGGLVLGIIVLALFLVVIVIVGMVFASL